MTLRSSRTRQDLPQLETIIEAAVKKMVIREWHTSFRFDCRSRTRGENTK